MSPRAFWRGFALLLCAEMGAADFPTLPGWSADYVVNVGEALDCGGDSEWTYKATDSEVIVRPQKEILARGRDRSGLAWRVQAEYPGDGGCRFFIHDLDGNGAHDLIFLTANGGSGPAGVTMTILAFDRERRPVPWQATSSFAVKGNRLLNFVDLNRDKKAELLFQHFEPTGTNGEFGISTALYSISDGYFRRVTGIFGGRTFPIRRPIRLHFAEEPDLTNALPVSQQSKELTKLQRRATGPCWLQDITITDKGIALAPNSTASRECEGYLQSKEGRVALPLITVLDLPKQGRVIDINHSLDVIHQAVKIGVSVALTGRACETGCRPFIMWARPR